MAYATVADLRDEGVTEAQASNTRLDLLIDEATKIIDRVTGWFFEPRRLTLHLDGRGTPSLELPFPLIRLYELLVNDFDFAINEFNIVNVGAPVQPGFVSPRLSLIDGRVFPKRRDNITINGLWGYTETDGTENGRTPLEIRRACMLLVIRMLTPLSDIAGRADVLNQWRIVEERTRDQSYKLAQTEQTTHLVGDPEIDLILARYCRPVEIGAV